MIAETKSLLYDPTVIIKCGGHEGAEFGGKVYRKGIKRCRHCDIFIKTLDIQCPYCGYVLKTRPRNSKSRRKETDTFKRIE